MKNREALTGYSTPIDVSTGVFASSVSMLNGFTVTNFDTIIFFHRNLLRNSVKYSFKYAYCTDVYLIIFLIYQLNALPRSL